MDVVFKFIQRQPSARVCHLFYCWIFGGSITFKCSSGTNETIRNLFASLCVALKYNFSSHQQLNRCRLQLLWHINHSRTQFLLNTFLFTFFFAIIVDSSVWMERTCPMSSGWLRNSTDPDEFLGLLISSRKMPLLSFFLSFSFESLIVN